MGYSLAYRNAGKGGERWAAAYLQSLGYRVLEANYRSRHREIDLIVEKEGILVFVEVKTRASNALLAAPCAVDWRKQMFLYSAASRYVRQHALTMDIRFDIIWVECRRQGRQIFYRVVEHIANAFAPFGG